MAAPAIITQAGTGASTAWFPDWMQVPFQISVAAIATGAATFAIECTWDNISKVDVGNVGTAAQATWFTVIALGSANATANFTTPVQAFRINLASSSATGTVTATFLQGMRGPNG